MPTTSSTINYYIAADGTLRDGSAGSIAQTPRVYYGTEYSVTLAFPASTIAEGDQLQVAVNRSRTFFSSASATGDAPVAAVAKHDVTSEEASAQSVTLTLSTNTRAMIDQVNGIDHPVRGFFGVHVLRGQSFISLAVADAFMLSVESGPDAISPSLPVVDYPTREEAEQIRQDTITAQGKAEEAQGKAEEAQGKAEEAQGKAETAATNAEKIAEGSDADVEPLGLEHSAKGWAQEAAATLASKRDILQTLVSSSSTSLEVEAGKSYKWTVSAASTISMKAADKVANKETRIDVYIDLQTGGSVTGSGVTIADSVLQSGWYKLIWDGTTATLYSTKAGGAESYITIPASTTAYSLQDNKHYQHKPDSVPAYTLPAVTMDGLVHEITVLVDFINVTSCSFVDASNVPVTLQSAISPQIGEAYVFRCYWYGKWRVVPLKIRNAATATSTTGVVEVSDAVAGDALALRMTAPRSVVVNQWIQNGDFSVSGTVSVSRWQGINGTIAIASNTCSYTVDNVRSSNQNRLSQVLADIISGHVYMCRFEVKTPYAQTVSITGYTAADASVFPVTPQDTSANTWTVYNKKVTAHSSQSSVDFRLGIHSVAETAIGDVTEVKNVMLVDLTQYFNGDSTKIAAIQTWDDLIAYDSRFAQYVAYNTGTVEGVTPKMKMTGKNLLNINAEFYQTTIKNPTDDRQFVEDEWFVGVSFNGDYWRPNYSYGSVSDNILYVGKQPNNINVYPVAYMTKLKRGESYIASFTLGGTLHNATVCASYYGEDCKYVSRTSDVQFASGAKTYAFTVPDDAVWVGLLFSNESDTPMTVSNIQLELGSVATSYEPYHDGGSAQAPSELFAVGNAADEFEAVSGVTTRKMGSYTFTGNEIIEVSNWRPADGYYAVGFPKSIMPDIKGHGDIVTKGNLICAWLEVKTYGEVYSTAAPTQGISDNAGNETYSVFIRVSTSIATDNTTLLTWLTGKTLYYELATPTTSQSTPTQISLQAGSNVAMQTDGGRTLEELSMTYENLPANE